MMLLEDILENNKEEIDNIIPLDFNKEKLFVFDFTKTNRDLEKIDMNSAQDFYRYIKETLRSNNSKIGIGKYNEDRIIYRHSPLFGTNDGELRTVHIGVDIFLPVGTKIYAPLDAQLHSFQNNKGIGDYGPTIILQHKIDGVVFYTLYGHLSEESLAGKFKGQIIKKGENIGEIGKVKVNGNWPEHVHFQIISDMMGKKGDFPGIATIREREIYIKLCPNPNLILKIKKLI